MNKFLVLLMMVLFAVPALAQYRPDYNRPGYGRPSHPRPGYGRPDNGGSCMVSMVNRRGRVINSYYGYNNYYSRGCANAFQQCHYEIQQRNMYANRCVLNY